MHVKFVDRISLIKRLPSDEADGKIAVRCDRRHLGVDERYAKRKMCEKFVQFFLKDRLLRLAHLKIEE